MTDITTICVHGERDAIFYKGKELGLDTIPLSVFRNFAHDIILTVNVDLETGIATIIEVDGRRVEPEKKII